MEDTYVLYIIRRDIRIYDNTGMIAAEKYASKNGFRLVVGFVLNPVQVGRNPYKSERALAFMLGSLIELDEELRKLGSGLVVAGSDAELLKIVRPVMVFATMDYTLFSRARDERLATLCDSMLDKTLGIRKGITERGSLRGRKPLVSLEDYMLGSVNDVKLYKKFTPYYEAARKLSVAAPRAAHLQTLANQLPKSTISLKKALAELKVELPDFATSGRSAGLKLLKKAEKTATVGNSATVRQYVGTHLGPHIKFGTVSIREVYAAVGEELRRQLYWRNFYYSIAYHFPYVLGPISLAKSRNWRDVGAEHGAKAIVGEGNETAWWHSQIRKVMPSAIRKQWLAWVNGKTGVPFVDAGMRQLKSVGYLPNRVRLVVASFLIKDLHISWEDGEMYFAHQLIDYDPALNNGNWQWVAGCGVDAQPYYRVFNPYRQSEKFDKYCEYIKQWVPELRDVPANDIHKWEDCAMEWRLKGVKYPAPIVKHAAAGKPRFPL